MVILVSLSFIENYENELKKETEKVKAEYENFKNEAEARVEDARIEAEDARIEAEDARAETRAIKENSEQFFSEINSNAEKLGLSDCQKEILFSTSVKF